MQFELRGSNVVHDAFQSAASHIVTVNTNWQQVVINGGWQNGSYAQFAVNFLTRVIRAAFIHQNPGWRLGKAVSMVKSLA